MITLQKTALTVTVTTTGLIAGLFYAWSCSVLPGITRLPDTEYLRAMQSMNRAILNPVFFLSFMGTALLLPLSTFLHYQAPPSPRFWFLLAATVVYLAGGTGITMFGNVPLNNMLDAFDISTATNDAITAQRIAFEGSWGRLHSIRTVACIASLVLAVVACLSRPAAAMR